MTIEWLIRVKGRVQGVGFRRTVKHLAESHHIVGFVRNCPDGTVEICAQAEKKEFDVFLNSLRQVPGIHSIDDIAIEQRQPNQIFSSFSIL